MSLFDTFALIYHNYLLSSNVEINRMFACLKLKLLRSVLTLTRISVNKFIWLQ